MAIEKVVTLRVQDDFTKTETTVKSLRAQLREATANVAEMSDRFGATSREAAEAAKRAAELRDRIEDTNDTIQAFKGEGAFLATSKALTAVSSGFTAVQGAAGLFGEENKELEKTLLRVQSAMALSSGLAGLEDAGRAFKTLSGRIKETAAGQAVLTAAQSAYTFVVGASTTALKALRVALISTGVGALVVGLGMLIANFEKISNWVGNLIEKFGGWRNVLAAVSLPIWAIVKALEAMGIIESEAEEKSRKADEAKAKRKAEQAKQLEKDVQRLADYYDFEIAKAEASGKSTIELERKKRDAILAKALAINEAMRAQIAEGKATEEEVKRWNENQKIIIQARRDGTLAELKYEKEKNDKIAEQQKEANQKARERRKAELDELNKALQDANDITLKLRLTQQQFEEKQVNDKYEKLINLAKKYGKDTESLEDARLNAINDIGLKYQQAKVDRENAELEAKRKRDAELFAITEENERKRIETIIQLNDSLLQAQETFEQARMQIVNDGLNLMQTLVGKNKALASLFLAIEKALAISQIIANAAKSIAQQKAAALTAGMVARATLGPILGEAYAAKVNAMSLKNIAVTKTSAGIAIATIAAQTIQSIAGNLSGAAGGDTGGGGGEGGAPAAPQFNVVGQNANNQLAATIAGQQGQPIRTYVVGQEVTTQQSLDRQIRTTATFNS